MIVPHVKYFNVFYFVAIFCFFLITVLCVLLCKKKGKAFTNKFVLVLIWANFALHFLKLFLPYAVDNWPYSIATAGIPNLCAFLVVFSPLLYLSKNKYLRDYWFYIGVLSGFLVFFWPTTPAESTLDGAAYVFECIRFYFCHLVIFLAPLVALLSGLHHLEFKRLWSIPVIFCAVEVVICAHCIICGLAFHVPGYGKDWFGPNSFFGRSGGNESMQFGPQSKFDSLLGNFYKFYLPYILSFTIDGVTYFVPAIWIFPLILLGTYIIGPLMILGFQFRESKINLVAWKQQRKMRRNARSNK